jgi:hypothetical protein
MLGGGHALGEGGGWRRRCSGALLAEVLDGVGKETGHRCGLPLELSAARCRCFFLVIRVLLV